MAAAVVEGGEAQLFAGDSGSSKSTFAKLTHPRGLFSDEASIVKRARI
jgi:hypothetical protein